MSPSKPVRASRETRQAEDGLRCCARLPVYVPPRSWQHRILERSPAGHFSQGRRDLYPGVGQCLHHDLAALRNEEHLACQNRVGQADPAPGSPRWLLAGTSRPANDCRPLPATARLCGALSSWLSLDSPARPVLDETAGGAELPSSPLPWFTSIQAVEPACAGLLKRASSRVSQGPAPLPGQPSRRERFLTPIGLPKGDAAPGRNRLCSQALGTHPPAALEFTFGIGRAVAVTLPEYPGQRILMARDPSHLAVAEPAAPGADLTTKLLPGARPDLAAP